MVTRADLVEAPLGSIANIRLSVPSVFLSDAWAKKPNKKCMNRVKAIRLFLSICLTALLLAAFFGCSTTHRAMDPSNRSEYLTEKVKNTRNAYLRFAQAEEDARKDNNPDAAESYRQAKEQARQDYERFTQELSQYEAERVNRLRQQ